MTSSDVEDPIVVEDATVIAEQVYPGNDSYVITWFFFQKCYIRSLPTGLYMVSASHPLYGNASDFIYISTVNVSTITFYI
jgi:hypothetical protein